MLYKYRDLSNLQFSLDILVNKRLYASVFTDLNDPMEGHFVYGDGKLPAWMRRAIIEERSEYRILSLSEKPNNMLMWSHYAGSHEGVVFGVELGGYGVCSEPIVYCDNFVLDIQQDDVVKSIFTRKHKAWEYEKEHRVIVKEGMFAPVEIKELIFGVKANSETVELLTSVAQVFSPDIKVRRMTEKELNSAFDRKC